MGAFVSTYRCGAVPDLHRSSLLSHSDRRSESGTDRHNISGWMGSVNPTDCGLTVDKPENSKMGAELANARKFSRGRVLRRLAASASAASPKSVSKARLGLRLKQGCEIAGEPVHVARPAGRDVVAVAHDEGRRVVGVAVAHQA